MGKPVVDEVPALIIYQSSESNEDAKRDVVALGAFELLLITGITYTQDGPMRITAHLNLIACLLLNFQG
jgi:hypothetical protein